LTTLLALTTFDKVNKLFWFRYLVVQCIPPAKIDISTARGFMLKFFVAVVFSALVAAIIVRLSETNTDVKPRTQLTDASCSQQAWPYLGDDCVRREQPRAVRVLNIPR